MHIKSLTGDPLVKEANSPGSSNPNSATWANLFPLAYIGEPCKMKIKIAKYISVIGHPLLTIPLFVVSILFRFQDFNSALLISILMVFGIILPLTIKMYRSEKKGVYTNFDVSDQTERKSWYFFAFALLAITVVILFVTNQSREVRFGFMLSALLLLSSQVINYYIKSSLHVSFNMFLSFLILPFNIYLAILFFLFVFFIAWSRVYLRRHTIKEVTTGAIIGIIFGLLLQSTVRPPNNKTKTSANITFVKSGRTNINPVSEPSLTIFIKAFQIL